MAYDRNLIILLLSGSQCDREAAKKNADNLEWKHPFDTETVTYDHDSMLLKGFSTREVQTAVAKLTKHSRLYLVGHGSADSKTVGGMTGSECAEFLDASRLTKVKRISVVSCYAGGNPSQLIYIDTFGENLAWDICRKVDCDVVARTERTAVRDDGRKLTQPDKDTPHVHKRPGSKLLYQWNGHALTTSGVY